MGSYHPPPPGCLRYEKGPGRARVKEKREWAVNNAPPSLSQTRVGCFISSVEHNHRQLCNWSLIAEPIKKIWTNFVLGSDQVKRNIFISIYINLAVVFCQS